MLLLFLLLLAGLLWNRAEWLEVVGDGLVVKVEEKVGEDLVLSRL